MTTSPREVLERGAAELAEALGPAGFAFVAVDEDDGSGGASASGEFRRGERRLAPRSSLARPRPVPLRRGVSVARRPRSRCPGARANIGRGRIPGFSDDPAAGFRHLRADLDLVRRRLPHWGRQGLSGPEEVAGQASEARAASLGSGREARGRLRIPLGSANDGRYDIRSKSFLEGQAGGVGSIKAVTVSWGSRWSWPFFPRVGQRCGPTASPSLRALSIRTSGSCSGSLRFLGLQSAWYWGHQEPSESEVPLHLVDMANGAVLGSLLRLRPRPLQHERHRSSGCGNHLLPDRARQRPRGRRVFPGDRRRVHPLEVLR